MRIATLFILTLTISGAFSPKLYAQDVEAHLKLIEQKLKQIEQTQVQILQGQQKLSQEHAQLKIWINKRR